eukprot:gnl/TRDRNA2_/TRDRNA2_143839_c1_seq1.p1 gnl/TRDRNA2_/TRDRNA2_143839_c1~~gnl/TRDRNA2_/TRDRNA2_143839_c1_seq1.p1  ORF type:complete len:202 (+),score=23.57 gnl/TRDRNA2_/TRDRNA2_143839_c1_seq1:63-608(+)
MAAEPQRFQSPLTARPATKGYRPPAGRGSPTYSATARRPPPAGRGRKGGTTPVAIQPSARRGSRTSLPPVVHGCAIPRPRRPQRAEWAALQAHEGDELDSLPRADAGAANPSGLADWLGLQYFAHALAPASHDADQDGRQHEQKRKRTSKTSTQKQRSRSLPPPPPAQASYVWNGEIDPLL